MRLKLEFLAIFKILYLAICKCFVAFNAVLCIIWTSTSYSVKVGCAMKKTDNHEITPLLFVPVGNIKVFFYVPINLIYLSPYNQNRDCFVIYLFIYIYYCAAIKRL